MKFKSYLRENTDAIFNKIINNEKVLEFLMYLIHDKEHAMNNNKKEPQLDFVFNLVKNNKSNVKLYRGLYLPEVKILNELKEGDVIELKKYKSFSEDESFAKHFANKSKSFMMLTEHIDGFNYWKFGIYAFNDLKKNDPSAYNASDGDYMIESFEEEKEWIFDFDSKFKLDKKEEKNGYTYYIGKIIK